MRFSFKADENGKLNKLNLNLNNPSIIFKG